MATATAAKNRAAILHFVLWLAIFRTVFNHWSLLNQATTTAVVVLNPQQAEETQLRHEFQVVPLLLSSSSTSSTTNYYHDHDHHDHHRQQLRRRHLRQTIQPPARFLMGIFTVKERGRLRDAVRRTIAWYNDSRICAMGTWNGTMPPPPPDHCLVIYTFVMGANPNGATQIASDNNNNNKNGTRSSSSSGDVPLLTTPPKSSRIFKAEKEPNDITYLNIKENMNDGKSSTWFHYASTVMAAYDLDYAIKCDMDTALRVDKFFDFANDNLPRGGRRIYSGKAVYSKQTKRPYMEGQFYLLSRDLAELVGAVSLQHTKVAATLAKLEDADIGAIVHDVSPSVHYIPVIPIEKFLFWRHKLKGDVYHQWFLQLESNRLCGTDNATVAPVSCHHRRRRRQ